MQGVAFRVEEEGGEWEPVGSGCAVEDGLLAMWWRIARTSASTLQGGDAVNHDRGIGCGHGSEDCEILEAVGTRVDVIFLEMKEAFGGCWC